MITAEEFMLENLQSMDMSEVEHAMIEFAKMHLRNAIEAQCKNARIKIVKSQDGSPDIIEVDKDSILEAYPLDNIK